MIAPSRMILPLAVVLFAILAPQKNGSLAFAPERSVCPRLVEPTHHAMSPNDEDEFKKLITTTNITPMDPPKSPLMDTSSAAPSEEQLPVVQVTGINEFGVAEVLVKWGIGGATQTASGEYGKRYDADPYYFSAVFFSGEEPVIKAFSTLLGCNGGILTIRGTRYRIQVTEPDPPKSPLMDTSSAMDPPKNDQDEFNKLIATYEESHDFNGYSFSDFVVLGEADLNEFVGKAKFRHKGKFRRIFQAAGKQQEGPPPKKLKVEEGANSPDLREFDSDRLAKLKVVKRDDYVLIDPFRREAFVGREAEKQFIQDQLKDLATATRNDKKHKFVVECATMSGAGKSRLMFNIFRGMKFTNLSGEELPVHVIRANFNGADGGRDLKGVRGKNVRPEDAACRLLLTRGLLQCSPDASCIDGLKVEDKNLPKPEEITKAIFRKIFGDSNEKGIVVVHLDELGFLVEARKDYEDENSPGSALKWVKQYIYSIVALSEPDSDRILVPVITHTSPVGRIFHSDSLSQAEYIPWTLYPFSVNGLWEIHDQNRELRDFEPVPDETKLEWSACVALTGGNPSLFLDAFPYTQDMPSYNSANVNSVISKLLDNRRVNKLPETVTRALAKDFLLDVFLTSTVSEDKHHIIKELGWAWFEPEITCSGGYGETGKVSTPFPNLVGLMRRAGGVFLDVAIQLDPKERAYQPTKAMEYVAALGFLVTRVGSVEDWVERDFAVRENIQALNAMKLEEKAFMSVWPNPKEKATGFGGKVEVKGTMTAVIGQVKMQDFGKDTTQKLEEVMKLAWFIGEAVQDGYLGTDIPVLAVFVSSRKAQKNHRMKDLKHAFCVAMSGEFTRIEAYDQAKSHHQKGKKRKGKTQTVSIDHVIRFLNTKEVRPGFDFEYVGRSENECDPNVMTELSDLLPAGVFAGWS